ncbi:MAG: hypothetical protein WD029_10845 [Microthrixaceae bacterium]
MRALIHRVLLYQPDVHSEQEQDGQSGFALIAVLAVIAITSVTIGALLGMMLTAIKITENQQRDARQARAADGAVTAAINQLRLNQTNPLNACLPEFGEGGALTLPFESSGRSDMATVACSSAADELGGSVGDIKLSGEEYKGVFNWKTWGWPPLQPSIDTAKPTLVHQGASSLKFNGSMISRGGTAPLRTDSGGTPAVDVRGSYVQGEPGIGAVTGAGGSCGALDGAAALAQTALRASAGATCGNAQLVPVSVSQDYAIDESVPTSPNLTAGSSCPSTDVITFSPGKYDQNAVATLNKWFGRGVGACTNKTFHFPSGRYWFDANTVSNGVGAPNQHALTFDNPSSNFVFGKANGWNPLGAGATAVNFPKACDPAIPGASIILSARTEFRHLAGRLAVCPYYAGNPSDGNAPYPAVLQQAEVPTQIIAVRATSPPGNFSNVGNLLLGPTATPAAAATFGCRFNNTLKCDAKNEFTVTLSSFMSGEIDSLSLNITGAEVLPLNDSGESANGVSSRKVELTVTLANGTSCVVNTDGAPYKAGIASYELLAGDCAQKIQRGEQLEGAGIKVEYKYELRTASGGLETGDSLNEPGHKLSLEAVQVVANPGVGSSTGSYSGNWDTQSEFSLELGNFSNFTNGIVGTSVADASQLESLGVVISQPPRVPSGNWCTFPCVLGSRKGETVLTLKLNDPDRTVCTRTFSRISNQPGDHYYPLLNACGPQPLKASSLVGSSLKVKYVGLKCGFGLCGQAERPLPIVKVGLAATTDSYSGPVIKSQLTIDSAAAVPASGGTGGPASANFFGSAYLKNVALDLNWNGQASGASLFGGELQLNSLGSLMASGATTDVVCCSAPETNIRKVRVTATIGGVPKLSAVVAINRDLPSAAPVVLEWTVCGRNGDCTP